MNEESLSYQQVRLLEVVANAQREGREYLLTPIEREDANLCVAAGLLETAGDIARLTDDGAKFIIRLNT
jgi:hypothetical protein